jgi:hypothetical protein
VPQPLEITWQNVVAFAPEVSRISPEAQERILFYVNEISGDTLGGAGSPTLHLARVLLAAHWGLSFKRAGSGAAGPVTSEAMGQLRRSYGLIALSAAAAGLGSTIYGQQLVQILNMSDCHGPILVR